MLSSDNTTTLAIVPIFVNTGAALLPTILGALASVAAIVFKPRELLRVCRRRPYIPVIVLFVAVGAYFGISYGLKHAGQNSQSVRTNRQHIDWSQVAIQLIRDKERAQQLAGIGPVATVGGNESSEQAGAKMYRGNALRNGYAGGGSPVDLVPLWEYGDNWSMYPSSPVVVDNKVFGASCLVDPPDTYGAVFCLDAKTGEELWYADLKNPDTEAEFRGFFSSPAVTADGRYLVIGQGMHYDANCELVCLDTTSGDVHWLIETTLHIEGSPAIEGDLCVAGAGAIEVGDDHKAQGDPGFVLGVRISDGTELWRYALNDPESSPAIDSGIAYIGSGVNGSAVVALRTEPDEQLQQEGLDRLVWQTQTPHPATGAVTLTEELVLIGCGNSNYVFIAENPEGFVLALDRKSGAVRWEVSVPDAVLGAIAVREDTAICPVRNGEVIAINLAKDGEILWRTRINDNTPVLAGPAFTGEFVYAVSQDGYIVILNADDGTEVERHYINAPGKPGELGLSVSSPYVTGGRVYLGSETGGLRCFVGKEVK